jgi:hypothetical protein
VARSLVTIRLVRLAALLEVQPAVGLQGGPTGEPGVALAADMRPEVDMRLQVLQHKRSAD